MRTGKAEKQEGLMVRGRDSGYKNQCRKDLET
jgi:hypothetical protein